MIALRQATTEGVCAAWAAQTRFHSGGGAYERSRRGMGWADPVAEIESWLAIQWPEASYPLTALIVGILGAIGKWLDVYFRQPAAPPDGVAASDAPVTPRVRRWLLG